MKVLVLPNLSHLRTYCQKAKSSCWWILIFAVSRVGLVLWCPAFHLSSPQLVNTKNFYPRSTLKSPGKYCSRFHTLLAVCFSSFNTPWHHQQMEGPPTFPSMKNALQGQDSQSFWANTSWFEFWLARYISWIIILINVNSNRCAKKIKF